MSSSIQHHCVVWLRLHIKKTSAVNRVSDACAIRMVGLVSVERDHADHETQRDTNINHQQCMHDTVGMSGQRQATSIQPRSTTHTNKKRQHCKCNKRLLLVRVERAEPTMKQTPTQIEQRQHINRACTLWALGWSASNGVEPTMKHNSDQ